MLKNLTIIICSIILLTALSCKKRTEPLSWDSDWIAPVATGSLTIADLLPDSLLEVEADSSLWLIYKSDLYNFDLSNLVDFKDTTFLDTFALPFFSTVNFSPGQSFINQPEENVLEIEGAELKSLKIKSGNLVYKLESTIAGQIIYNYKIPSATDENGNMFSKFVTVPTGSQTNHTITTGSFSLDGYTIDLTGSTGNGVNKILTIINVKVDPSNPGDIGVSNQDTLFISNKIDNIIIENAEGYFGQHQISTGWEYSAFDGLKKFTSGSIEIEDLSLNFNIENGIGIDGSAKIIGIATKNTDGSSTPLLNSIIGSTITLNRAIKVGNSIYPYEYSRIFDNSNSNVATMLSQLPDSIGFNFDVSINPLGNTSGHNDFIYDSHPLRMTIDARMPLSIIANQLTLEDTITVNISDTSMINSLEFYLDVENGFPLSANISIGKLDPANNLVAYTFAPNDIQAASLGMDGKVNATTNSKHTITLNKKDIENLKISKKLYLKIVFNTTSTTQFTQLYDYYSLDYKLKANANIRLQIK